MIFTFLLPLIPCILVTTKKLSTEKNERKLEICEIYKLEYQDNGTYEMNKIQALAFHPCGVRNDIALIEIRSNICDCISTPICMPDENHVIDQVLYSTAYGTHHSHNHGFNERNQPQVVAQMFVGVDRTEHKIVTNAYGNSTCQGDSGGPVFQTNSNKHILIGITSTGDACTRTNEHNILSLAVDCVHICAGSVH